MHPFQRPIRFLPETDYPRASRSFPRIAGSGNEIEVKVFFELSPFRVKFPVTPFFAGGLTRSQLFKGQCDGKWCCLFIVYSESISVDKQSYQISASNSISFCLFFQRKHANFSAAITEIDVDFLGGYDVIYSTPLSTRFFPEGEINIIKGFIY